MNLSVGSDLISAILKRDFEKCQIIYQKNKSLINLKNVCKRTPLSVAIATGNLKITKWIYDNGGNKDIYEKDKSNLGPLHIAIREGHVDIIKWLYRVSNFNDIKISDTIDQKPLWFICNHTFIPLDKRLEIAKFLITKEVVTGDSGNYDNDIIYKDILNYVNEKDFKNELSLWVKQKINNSENLLDILIKGTITNKSDNIYKIDNFCMRENLEYSDILLGKKLKYFKLLEKY
tara:strand:+ start:3882 stop:4577 length:696 start_codon:yes stop_codon:yes gene_type:complete